MVSSGLLAFGGGGGGIARLAFEGGEVLFGFDFSWSMLGCDCVEPICCCLLRDRLLVWYIVQVVGID